MTHPAAAAAAALLAGAAVLAWSRPRGVRPPAGRPAGRRVPVRAALAALGLAPALLLVSTGSAPARAVWLCALGAAGLLLVARLLGVVRARRLAVRRAEELREACDLLAGELLAGRPPSLALHRVSGDLPVLAPVAAAADLGGDVPASLVRLGAVRGLERARVLAAAWQVAHAHGAGLAQCLADVARSLQEEQRTRQVVAGELASARATVHVMALLPAVLLLLCSAMGGDPWSFLLGTTAGLACLSGGLLLSLAGLAWIERLAGAVT